MAEVGVAFVSIVPSAKGFGSALNQQVGSASTVAGATGGKKAGSSFVGGFKGAVGPALAVVAGAGIVKGLRGAIAEAREAQKVGALTAQVIKTTGGAANVTAKEVGQLSTAISNNVGVDDELIQKGANLLLTFKNVRNEVGAGNAIFNRATQSAVNLSAAGFGSVESASKMLGKALNDPVKGMTALGRAGVTFTEGQKKQIKALVKSGDVLGAQKIILKEVESQVGGAARASSTAGEKMKVAWDNAKESLGTALLPAIDKLQNAITTKIIPAIVQFIGFLQKNPAIVKAFAIGIAAIAAAFVVAFIAANAIVFAIGAVVAALVYAYTQSETFRNIVGAVFSFISAWVKFHMKVIVTAVRVGVTVVKAIWATIKAIVGFVRGAFNFVRSIIRTVMDFVKKHIIDKIRGIIADFKAMPGKIKTALGNLKDTLVKKGKDLVQGFINGIKAAPGKIKDALLSLLPAPLKKFAGKLGLASPSKLFAKYGKWTVQGYVKGIDKERRTVAPAVASIANAAVGAGQVGIGGRFSSANLATPGSGAGLPDMPIVDGSQIIGYLRDIATDRARIEITRNDQRGAMQARYATP